MRFLLKDNWRLESREVERRNSTFLSAALCLFKRQLFPRSPHRMHSVAETNKVKRRTETRQLEEKEVGAQPRVEVLRLEVGAPNPLLWFYTQCH